MVLDEMIEYDVPVVLESYAWDDPLFPPQDGEEHHSSKIPEILERIKIL